eukprot:10730333-Alexandrium_andersonii.AAC.1
MCIRDRLDDFSPVDMSRFTDYVLGERVAGLCVRDPHGDILARAPWPQVLAYELELRKRAYELVRTGAHS